MAGWIKIPLGMEVALGPGDFVLDGDPAPPPQKGALKGAEPPPPIFGQCLLWQNGCVDQDQDGLGMCYMEPSSPGKGHSSPLFSAHV